MNNLIDSWASHPALMARCADEGLLRARARITTEFFGEPVGLDDKERRRRHSRRRYSEELRRRQRGRGSSKKR